MDAFNTGQARQRVSCAGLCLITDEAGRCLLGLNQARLLNGSRLYTPIGGALRYLAADLLDRFGAVTEVPGSDDLRLYIDANCVGSFREWFYCRCERETEPFRELREELVDEYGLLAALSPADVEMTYLYTFEKQRASDRSGMQTPTCYFHDIFRVRFCSADVRASVEAAPAASGLRWFSLAELRAGVGSGGETLSAETILPGLEMY
jgi:hypothetical protein